MNSPRLSLLVSSVLLVPMAPVVGAAAPAAAESPSSTPGSHISACAQTSGFTGQHKPSHHRGHASHGMHGMHGMHG